MVNNRSGAAGIKLAKAFAQVGAVGQDGIDFAGLPFGKLVRKALFDLRIQQPFEAAITAFAQRRIDKDRQLVAGGNRVRSLAGALQVAGDDHVDLHACQRTRDRRSLALAFGVQGDVEMALQAPLGVPGSFAVAY
jgi:hypothetical protein